jgi:hypothetical protein
MARPRGSRVPRKIVCLETNWGDHNVRLFQHRSVRPFLEVLGAQFDPPLAIAHRFVDSLAQLSFYTARPDGLLWRDPEGFDAPVFYLSFHGAPGALRSAAEQIGAGALCAAFEGWGRQYSNLIYFGACSVFAGRTGKAFARRFLEASGTRAVIGYRTDVDWVESMVTDMLFMRRFFSDTDPWTNLRAIHDSVRADFAPARRLGYEMHELR